MANMTLVDLRNLPEIVKNIRCDLPPEKVFAPRTVQTQEDIERLEKEYRENAGYYFYVDVCSLQASLALMHVKQDGSMTSERIGEFPEKALIEALEEAGGAINISGHYPINAWIKKLILFMIPEIGILKRCKESR